MDGATTTQGAVREPIIEHVHELQKRLTWIIMGMLAASGVAYGFSDGLLDLIQKPLNQTLYYTSPTGGLSFIVKLCLSVGLIASLPFILFNVFSFLKPLIREVYHRTILAFTVWSCLLAIAGVMFAYFISLPAALHFLAQFGGTNIQSLITANEYFNFALTYLTGFAVMFQIPLIILLINRIKPLKPSHAMGAQKYILLVSFITAAILTPTPDPVNQAIMAAPMVVMYQVGVVLAIVANSLKHKKDSSKPSRPTTAIENLAIPTLDELGLVPQPKTAPLPAAPRGLQPRRTIVPQQRFIDIIPPRSHRLDTRRLSGSMPAAPRSVT